MRLDLLDNGNLASQAASPGFGWMRLYCRLTGGIQMLYAGFFGWIAFLLLRDGQFYYPESFAKGHHPAYYDFAWLIGTPFCTLLFLSGLIGGYGLLGLRPWVRRWEAAYLGVLSVGVAAVTVVLLADIRSGPTEFTVLVLVSLAFALPFVPFLFGVVGGGTGATLLRSSGKMQPVSVSGSVWDRALDG